MIAQLLPAAPAAQYPEFLQALRANGLRGQLSADSVSYTHLTLPTSDLV